MTDYIRVFSGAGANGEDAEAQAVFEYTLRKNSSLPIDLKWMKLSRESTSSYYSDPTIGEGWRTWNWGTPYSALKWAVPALCGFRGRAIYADPDFVVRGDVSGPWDTYIPEGGIVIARRIGIIPRFNFCVWDCEAAKEFLPEVSALRGDPSAHSSMLFYFAQRRHLVAPLSPEWAALDSEISSSIPDYIQAYHCDRMNLQPYLRYSVPRLQGMGRRHWFAGTVLRHHNPAIEEEFDSLLREAQESGYTVDRYTGGQTYGDYVIAGRRQEVSVA